MHNGTWEEEQLNYLKRLAFEYRNDKAKKTFLDIGSYFGLYSLHMSRLNVFDEIIAFEADALNHRQLQANLLLNDPTLFIKTHNFAVSDNNGEAYFFPSWAHPSKNRGGVGLVAEELNLAHRVRVPTRMLDSVLSLSGNIIFIKIDVEGAEFSVLQGMRNILIKNRCVLQIESLIFNESDIESNKKRNDMLMEMGYRLIHSINPDNYYSNID
nr:FkbM family methyltransferase [Novacetimonas pomaceti]